MIQRSKRLRLVGETLGELGISHALRRKEFEGHQAVERLLPRLIDHAHPAPADFTK